MFDRTFIRAARNYGMLVVLVAVFAMAGCSCKEYEQQILQLDAQIAELQKDVADQEALIAERNRIAEELRTSLQDCKADNAALIEASEEVIMVSIPDQLSYASSQVIVLDTMVPTLEAIASAVRNHPDWDVYVEGFTDDLKISEEWVDRYPSNWELGAFRAAAVVRYMTNQLNLPADRFAAVSYGPFRPVASNDTAEGRSQNRMVRVVMYKPER
ncbi:MAG: OmpA family protein [Krumholzibacteria bacterium]|nr:OmpA family protein [Candidatus Krumholzibacteria bacterium]